MRRELPVVDADFGRAFPCACQQDASTSQRLSRLQRFSNLGVLSEVRFEGIDAAGPGTGPEAAARYQAALAAALRFAEEPSGSLTLLGGHGVGKTHLAAAVANRLMEQGHPVFFTFVPDFLDQIRGSYSQDSELTYDELFEQVKAVPMLILDDLGAHSGTPWAEEKLFQVINHRYLADLPTLVTSALQMERLDGRLQSRLSDPRSSRVIDMGGSVRGSKMAMGGIEPAMLRHMTFDSFEPNGRARDQQGRETLNAALMVSRSFAQDPDGWLVLVGDVGCGKTHLAVAVANEQLGKGEDVFFAFVPDLLDHLRYTFSPDSRVTYDELFDRVKQAPLLVLDDLGSESSTPWANEKLYQIIVHRYNTHMPTIITARAIPSGANDPVASRLSDARLVVVIPITAPDYRQTGRQQKERRPDGRY